VRVQEEWIDEFFTDRGNQNGNKLRTHRQFKQIRCTEAYVSRLVHIVSTWYRSVPRPVTKLKSISDHHREDSLKENGFQFQHSFYYIQHKVYFSTGTGGLAYLPVSPLKKRLMCVSRKNGMMNFLPIEETKMGTNYELIYNLSSIILNIFLLSHIPNVWTSTRLHSIQSNRP
jgi:hypothetical protein